MYSILKVNKPKKLRQIGIEKLNIKFPNIVPIENEDLNIERMIVRTLEKCFNEKKWTRTQTSIVTGISEKTMYTLIRKYNLRKNIKNIK
jgi:hypothetical protein